MKMPKNKLKAALKAGKLQLGLWSGLNSIMAAEILSLSSFDWTVIDMEHSPNDVMDVVSQLQAFGAGSLTPVVRPPWNDTVVLKRLLDAGVQSFVIPFIQNKKEAEAAVAATRYPPQGVRGVAGGRGSKFGMIENYYANAHKELCLILQVETAEAVDQIEEIASVKGVDAIFVGPADLAASMGHLGNFDHPEVQAKIKEAAMRIKKAGKPSGILSFAPDRAQDYIDMGFKFVAVGSDQGLLVSSLKALHAKFRP